MQYELETMEDNASVLSVVHVFVVADDERDEVLKHIKEEYPGEQIELTRHGFRVAVQRRKTQAEKDLYFSLHKPKPLQAKDTWEQEMCNSTRPKKGKK